MRKRSAFAFQGMDGKKMIVPQREERETGRDYARRVITENIVHLRLVPGSKVSENELATEMGLSRTPIREALMELAKVKIVEVYPQRGSFISLIDYALVEEAQFMRETLECAVVERCATQGLQQTQLAFLQENLDLQAYYLQSRGQRVLELDNEFHRTLFQIARLEHVHQLMDSMTVHFDRVRALALSAVKEIKVVEDHRLLLSALVSQDTETAKSLMKKHLSRYRLDREVLWEKYPDYMQN